MNATTSTEDNLRFRTRNYKHECRLNPNDARSILKYTDETWHALCRGIVQHGFNGLVLYSAYHPFEYFLDYKGYEHAATVPARQRTAIRKALRRGLAIAKGYGLTTFMQHYVWHFTQPLADACGIRTLSRLTGIEHPEVTKYVRWCYRETFRQVPELDGLYFNFESSQNAAKHVLETAIHEFNRMSRKPIIVYRLWGFNDLEAMREMIATYKGRTILGHKISDTNDVYYLPVADSRATEWTQRLGGDVEFMFLLGPCHNCGTNLCQQLWGDYDFVQQILADAEAKGARSISFHSVNEFLSPDCPAGVFGRRERELAAFNYMHLLAVSDYIHGRRLSKAKRAAALAERVGAPAKAGGPLYDAVHASSQLVLLAFQQFFHSSASEGYINPGRFSHTQGPFFFYPANWVNDQVSRTMWEGGAERSWLKKSRDTKVAPDDAYQPVIDYVDPSVVKAKLHPKKLADQLARQTARSREALAAYRKAAGAKAAGVLEPYIEENALLGEYVEHEIRSALALYPLYFAKTRPAIVRGLKHGLDELKTLAPMVASPGSAKVKLLVRALLMDRLDPSVETASAKELLDLMGGADLPMPAWQAYVESRRLYNEVRRSIRPLRMHSLKTIAAAAKLLVASEGKAAEAVALLESAGRWSLARNVRAWRAFVAEELAHTTPPAMDCPTGPTGNWVRLYHNTCFRSGYNFLDDFVGFFRPIDYPEQADLFIQIWRTRDSLAIALREENADVAARRAVWADPNSAGSLSFVEEVFVDAERSGTQSKSFIIWPEGQSVSTENVSNVEARAEFYCDATSWQTTAYLPFKLIGRTPAKGDSWAINVTSNPYVARNRCYTWAPQYDSTNEKLFGQLRFI